MSGLDSILVNQKDRLIGMINNGEYDLAYQILKFNYRFWNEMGYAYKTKELAKRLLLAIETFFAEHHIGPDEFPNMRKLYANIKKEFNV